MKLYPELVSNDIYFLSNIFFPIYYVVTINGTSTFKGFLCQPRPDPNNYNTSGSLSATGNTQVKNNCGTVRNIT